MCGILDEGTFSGNQAYISGVLAKIGRLLVNVLLCTQPQAPEKSKAVSSKIATSVNFKKEHNGDRSNANFGCNKALAFK